MEMLTRDAFARLDALGQRVRDGLSDLIEARGLGWQVAGQSSLFKLHTHPRPLVDYSATAPTKAEQASAERVHMAMLGEGIMLTPDLAGCVSTPMTDVEVDHFIAVADRAFEQTEDR